MSAFTAKISKAVSVLFLVALSLSGVFAGEPDQQECRHHPIGSREISEVDSQQMREDRQTVANKDEEEPQDVTEDVLDLGEAICLNNN